MAFSIAELHELETDITHARVNHGNESFDVIIPKSVELLESLPNEFLAELDYQSVLRYETGLAKDDASSGIFATEDPSVVLIDGSVSNLLEIDPDHVLVDVYVRKGPEFIAVISEELGDLVPEVGSRIRIWFQGLKLYPSLN